MRPKPDRDSLPTALWGISQATLDRLHSLGFVATEYQNCEHVVAVCLTCRKRIVTSTQVIRAAANRGYHSAHRRCKGVTK